MMIPALGPARRRTSIPYAMPAQAPWNVPTPANIPTYDGSGQSVHPSVIDFHHVIGDTWNGWRYWMAFTPYYNSIDDYENPSIVVSQDGYTWHVPDGLTNPIYPMPAEGWNSDTHLQYDPATDKLVLLYRGYDARPEPYLATSSDGVTWPETPVRIDFSHAGEVLSPALVRADGFWYMYGLGVNVRTLMRWTSTDLSIWGGPEPCTGIPDGGWHLDVQLFDGQYWLLMDKGPAFLNFDDGYFAGASSDGLNWASGSVFMQPVYEWEMSQLYRACVQPHEDGVNMRMWYSACNPTGKWHTGYTIIPRSLWPAPPTP